MEKLLLMKKICQNKKHVDTLLLNISCVKLATVQNTKTTEKIPFDLTIAFRRDPKDIQMVTWKIWQFIFFPKSSCSVLASSTSVFKS